MTQLQAIKAEIERRKRENAQLEDIYYSVDDTKNAAICRHRRILCEQLLSFIDSLWQEQPEVDLEKEMDKLVSLEYVNQTDDKWEMCIARHFYELGLNARKK